jgi:hypothetical protein
VSDLGQHCEQEWAQRALAALNAARPAHARSSSGQSIVPATPSPPASQTRSSASDIVGESRESLPIELMSVEPVGEPAGEAIASDHDSDSVPLSVRFIYFIHTHFEANALNCFRHIVRARSAPCLRPMTRTTMKRLCLTSRG